MFYEKLQGDIVLLFFSVVCFFIYLEVSWVGVNRTLPRGITAEVNRRGGYCFFINSV